MSASAVGFPSNQKTFMNDLIPFIHIYELTVDKKGGIGMEQENRWMGQTKNQQDRPIRLFRVE